MVSMKSGAWVALALAIFTVSALGCASTDTKPVATRDLSSIAGRWTGSVTLPGGTTTQGTVDIGTTGDYVLQAGAFAARGTASLKDGDVVFTPSYSSGSGANVLGRRSSTASITTRPDGTLVMTGFGHSDGGPFNFMATRQK